MTAQYGLIGYPLTHSFSPGFFSEKFRQEGIDAEYNLFPIASISEFPALLNNNRNLSGLNVTLPYKETIIPFLDELDSVASSVGAVNCIAIRGDVTTGYNTDVIGFEQSLLPLLKKEQDKALVLGTGGAAKAVRYVLDKLGIASQNVSRKKEAGVMTYDELTNEIIHEHKLIVNATPVGMFPNTELAPALPYAGIGSGHLLYDLIYNPALTLFLLRGQARGAVVKNGLEMLQLQAIAAWGIWNRK